MTRSLLAAALLFAAACGGTSDATDGATDVVDDGGADDGTPPDGDLPVTDSSCGGQVLDLTNVAPSFLVVLDRSCSMKNKTVPGTDKSRWEIAVVALQGLLQQYSTDIRWGLTMFPDTVGAVCEQQDEAVPVADGTAPTIAGILGAALDPADDLYPDGPCVTNIDTGMAQVMTDPAFADATHPRYAMLVSDGAQSGGAGGCGGNERDVTTTETIATLKEQGVTTFVVGFGGDVDSDALNAFAVAGGAPRNGTQKFYAADNANQLAQAFSQIGLQAVSCEYKVDPAPPNYDDLYVYFDTTQAIERDPSHAMGWDYDFATQNLTFYGADCDRLKTHAVTDVDIVFGCPDIGKAAR